MRRLALLPSLLAALLALWAPPSASAAEAVKSTYRVPVTQPDESGGPVELDVDVYLPTTPPPASGHPFVEVFHGGGSEKANGFDAGHARFLAEHGYATLIYSARGHGDSDGQTTVAGPKEMRDTFDVTAWALGIGGRTAPAHPDFHIDPDRIALTGYSQGGLNTNLANAWSTDAGLNPYGIRFRATVPGNTPDVVFNALIPNQVVKLSFGVGLVGTYASGSQGRVSAAVDRWIATAAADQPALYGGDVCDFTGHDQPNSTMRQDLAARSVGCLADRVTVPVHWAQAFDDGLFPAEMGISMISRLSNPSNRLYLSMGGHAAPGAPQEVEDDKLRDQLAFLDHVLRGQPLSLPNVTYWTRDPGVVVPGGTTRWPLAAWYRQTADRWPPPSVTGVRYRLGADGRAVDEGPVASGAVPLSPPPQDSGNDPVLQSVLAPTPVGTTSPGSPPATGYPGVIAAFATAPLATERELSGSPSVRLAWTPASADTQLVLKLFDVASDGTMTFLTRGVTGVRGATPGSAQTVDVEANAQSTLVRRGHRLVAWISAGDASFYKAYPGSAGGSLGAGEASTLTLPLRSAAASGRPSEVAQAPPCRDRTAPRSRVNRYSVRARRSGVRFSGTATDRGCAAANGLSARAGRVRRIFVSLARATREGRCRFFLRGGGFGAPRSCQRTTYVGARGTTRWRFTVRGRLAPGRYKAWIRAVDASGNRERKRRYGNLVRFTVR